MDSPLWKETYRFKPKGYGWASETNKYIVSQFCNPINPKDGYGMSDCEDFRAKHVLEFLVPILYPAKPTRVTVTVGNTLFGALLGDRLVKCTLEPESILTASESRLEQPQPTPTPEKRKKRKTSANKRADSTATVEILSKDPEPSASKVERNAQAFDNTISWIETASENLDALGQIVKDVAEVLDIMDLRYFDKALGLIPRPRDLVEWDNRIWELQKERALLKVQLIRKESKLSIADQKTGEALHLLSQFQAYIRQSGEVVTKARIFDETVAKAFSMTGAKVINIVVDYSLKMETLLVKMWKLMVGPYYAVLQSTGLSSCPSVRVSWTSFSSVRLALGLSKGKVGVTPVHVADMSHSK